MLNENQTTNTEDNKAKIELLEESIKTAFSEEKYDDVGNIANQIQAIDPENHLALFMLKKVQKIEDAAIKSKAKADEKEAELRLKAEAKAEQEKEKVEEKARNEELKAEAKKNEDKIKEIESKLTELFKNGEFDVMNSLVDDLRLLDPQNTFGDKLLSKIEKAKESLVEAKAKAEEKEAKLRLKAEEKARTEELKAEAKANESKIKEEKLRLKAEEKEAELKIKAEAKAEEMKIKEEKLRLKAEEADKNEKIKAEAKAEEMKIKEEKLRLKAEEKEAELKIKAEANAEEEKVKLEAKAKVEELKILVENKNWDEVQLKANEILKNVKKQSDAIKALKIVAKEKNIENYITLITAYNAEEEMGIFEKLFYKKSKNDKTEGNNEKVEMKKEENNVESLKTAGFIGPINQKSENQTLKLEKNDIIDNKVDPRLREDDKGNHNKKVEKKIEITSKQEKGNVFTSMFGKKNDEVTTQNSRSIIDTIVQKTEESEGGSNHDVEKISNGARFKSLSGAFLQLSLAFVIVTAGFFYVENIDKQNTVLGLFGIEENYASKLHYANETLIEKKAEEKSLNRDINKYKSGYNNQYEDIINNIIEQRLNWPEILEKINEVTESVFEHNSLSQYVVYNSFSFDAEKGVVRVSGTMTDPLGKNLTKLIELEEAFKYYPKDKNDPNDKREPYFYDMKEFNSLAKSFNKNEGKYTSSLQLSFSTKKIN